ncbi:YcaO-like family protein [Pseudobacteriovorax antillogorgiicola]|uniref:YcaO-like family protein n=1 Tax=Pseudobacteriovorax antillogorgiicola TaxID=1513793 RepID=A0A1Y6CKD3_9BACT|nr:YcaO-like family protein [Pseudobacteriovorax antillogorgiicola]TCS46381.1 YcaO-like family protein [Pseudobacteriovorax antillogorgiicola]SMF68627.1 YcaO-like family protein [Pseudobacteriovorax antillogorgiicola]
MTLQFKKVLHSQLAEWTLEPPFVETATVCNLKIFGVGMIASHPKFGQAIGAAASLLETPSNRAWFELCERAAILEGLAKGPDGIFPIRDIDGHLREMRRGRLVFGDDTYNQQSLSLKKSKSNGVALYSNWPEACLRASLELMERHHILESWRGQTLPKRCIPSSLGSLHPLHEIYDPHYYLLGQDHLTTTGSIVCTVMVYFKPKPSYKFKAPCLYAFDCSESLELSFQHAEQELLQRLIFLWGEPLPKEAPLVSPDAQFHQDYYLYPENTSILDAWLAGEFLTVKTETKPDSFNMIFADLSSTSTPEYHVAKAICPETHELYFGLSENFPQIYRNKAQMVHPIP